MRHFFSKKIKLVLAMAALLTVLLGVAVSITGKAVPGTLVQSLLTPLRSGAYALTSQAERLYNYIYEFDTLKAENEALKAQLAQLQEEARQADALLREKQRLMEMLNFKEANEDFVLTDAFVIARSSSGWNSTFTVNRGENAGIEVGMCAISSNGEVAGVVREVGKNFAVVKTVLDSSLEISALVSSSGYSGVVSGNYTSGRSDMLRMDYLSSGAILRTNDAVVTAGSGLYPRNLILGYIVDAGFDDVGVSKYAILQPAADIENLEQVFILMDYAKE